MKSFAEIKFVKSEGVDIYIKTNVLVFNNKKQFATINKLLPGDKLVGQKS